MLIVIKFKKMIEIIKNKSKYCKLFKSLYLINILLQLYFNFNPTERCSTPLCVNRLLSVAGDLHT